MQPKVYIIILNWNGLDDTVECLKSATNLEYDNYKIVLVDNGSVDGSAEKIGKLYPAIKIIRNENNTGFTNANNQAMKYAMEEGAEFVWLLNNDTVFESNVLKILVEASKSPQVGLASPLVYYYEHPEKVQFCGSVIDLENQQIIHIDKLEELEKIGKEKKLSLWGTALIVKRKIISDVGYLNEKYFAYHEDEEYCLRVSQAGYGCIVVPDARVYHKNSRSTGSNDAPMQVFLRSRNRFFLWMDTLKGVDRFLHFPKYLAHIISYGSSLREKNLSESVEACLDGVWNAFRGVGGPRNPEVSMPIPLRRLFRFLFSWHPFLWTSLLTGDFAGIGENMRKRLRAKKAIL